MIHRTIEAPRQQSFFIFGPRQCGKSTWIEQYCAKKSWGVNLLAHDAFIDYSRNPSVFRLEAEKALKEKKVEKIYVDEIQRVPELLNEVQYLIDHFPKCQFILSGSSARKLKRQGSNLLAGRAVQRYLFPFIYKEIKSDFNLTEALLYGTLPAIYGRDITDKIDILSAYTNTYLKEEVLQEGIIRNLGAYARFLELAASQCGEIVSYSSIAREAYLPVRTVQSYYEVLEDTLIGFKLLAWDKSFRKQLVSHPKFYFFDTGVTNAINHRLKSELEPMLRGKLFEQWIILEVHRAIRYSQSETRMYYWRTNHGSEVDLVLEKHGKLVAAVEIKSNAHVSRKEISGLLTFKEDNPKVPCYLVGLNQKRYELDGVEIMDWKDFLENLDSIGV